MEKDETMFMVLKLLTDISYNINGETINQKLEGCSGFLPVFDNINDAEEASCDGKYDIVTIKPK